MVIKLKVITSGAVTSNVDLSNYYTRDEVDALIPNDCLKEIPSEYVTEMELDNKGYITLHQDLSGYAKLSDIPTDYLTEIPADYVTATDLDDKGYVDNNQLTSGYYSKTDIDSKGYITEHQSLENYYTKGDINAIFSVSRFELVDLGLPSGLLWATCNIGATKPEEYGLFFAWGETEGYVGITDEKQFSWADYKWCNGTYDTLTKYNVSSNNGTVDNLSQLEPEDDVAYITDNSCRMPTKVEVRELLNNTTFTWEALNGVSGGRFTGTNGNSIFIPASGTFKDGRNGSNPTYTGYICSSTTETGGIPKYPTRASAIMVQSNGAQISYLDRYAGFPIRAVLEANANRTLFKPNDYYTKVEIDNMFSKLNTSISG